MRHIPVKLQHHKDNFLKILWASKQVKNAKKISFCLKVINNKQDQSGEHFKEIQEYGSKIIFSQAIFNSFEHIILPILQALPEKCPQSQASSISQRSGKTLKKD